MFDFQSWIQTFEQYLQQHGTAYNDAAGMISLDDPPYQVGIEIPENPIWRVLGIHHLSPEENRGNHNVFLRALCKQGDQDGFRAMNWTWNGRQADEPAPPVYGALKGPDELVDIPLNLGMIVSVQTQGSGVVTGLSSNHPDEPGGNTIGHHSFFVCFQEIDPDEPDPDKPDPPTETADLIMKKSWLDTLTPDEDGYIRIYLDGL